MLTSFKVYSLRTTVGRSTWQEYARKSGSDGTPRKKSDVLVLPPLGNRRSDALYAHHRVHVIETRIGRHHVLVREGVVLAGCRVLGPAHGRDAAAGHLPEHQPDRVHVRHLERVERLEIERFAQHLRRHVAPGADARVRRDLDLVRLARVLDREPKVGDRALAVALHQDVLALDVPVRDRGFAGRAEDLRVQVRHTGRERVRQRLEHVRVEDALLQVVVQRAELVVVRDQQHLRPGARALDVGRDEPEDVLVAHQHRLVDFRLPEPGRLLGGEEDLHGHLLVAPLRQPHLTVAALAHRVHHVDLLGDRALHQQGQPGSAAAALLHQVGDRQVSASRVVQRIHQAGFRFSRLRYTQNTMNTISRNTVEQIATDVMRAIVCALLASSLGGSGVVVVRGLNSRCSSRLQKFSLSQHTILFPCICGDIVPTLHCREGGKETKIC
uniref:Uncharacterized protein n=1 Tax=Anopheles atroparvus TaxID=41427 RepID=A0A182J3S4_ANOAO